MPQILVEDLAKVYRVAERDRGVLGAVKGLVHRLRQADRQDNIRQHLGRQLDRIDLDVLALTNEQPRPARQRDAARS